MIDPKEFLANVLATNDDSTRLVYADYLEENGDLARADLIRAQCTIAAHKPWEREAVVAKFRADSALAEHGDRFRAELPELDGVEWTDFERGFASTVTVDNVATLVRHAEAIRTAAPVYRAHVQKLDETEPYIPGSVPWLRVLRVTSTEDVSVQAQSILDFVPAIEVAEVQEYQMLEWLSQRKRKQPLDKLTVEGGHVVGRQFIDELAAAPWAKQLAALRIGTSFVDYDSGYFQDPTLGEEGATVLTSFDQVEVLDIARQRVRDRGLARVITELPRVRELDARAAEATSLDAFETAHGAPIEKLDLSLNSFGDAGARALASAPRLAQLEVLELDTCELGGAGVRALVEAPFWSTLRVLDLSRNALGYDGIRALFDAPAPAKLHTLLLADVDMTPAAAELFVEIPWLRQLVVLDVSKNALRDAIGKLGALAGGSLAKLSIASCEVRDVKPLAPLTGQLVHLDLSKNLVTDDGIAAFARIPAPQLQSLNLRGSAIGGEGFRRLCTASLPKLRVLDVSYNELFPQSIVYLLRESPLADQLEHLDMSFAKQSPEIATELAATKRLARLRMLQLRDVSFSEHQMLAIARSEALRQARLGVSVDVWNFSQGTRDELAKRFGSSWWYYMNNYDEDESNANE